MSITETEYILLSISITESRAISAQEAFTRYLSMSAWQNNPNKMV